MKPTSKTLSWALSSFFCHIFTGLGSYINVHKQPLVLQGQAEATEIRISGNFPAVSTLSSFRRETGYTGEILLSSLIALKYMPSINKNALNR